MKVACVGYRDWSINIYNKLKNKTDHEFLMQLSKEDFSEKGIQQFDPDIVLFYGWSDIVSVKLIENFKCLMLHPSPLPKYRGGSPIQNQIIRGEIHSAISIFLMNEGTDTGPIVDQAYLSLSGSIKQIFNRIEVAGYKLTRDILDSDIVFKDQNHKQATYFERRKPHESEITIEELETKSSEYLINKIRMLQDPYPRPYIITADKKKLYIHEVSLEEES